MALIVANPVVGEYYKLGAKSGDIRELLDWNWVDIDTYDGSKYLQFSVVKINRVTPTHLFVDIYNQDDLILDRRNVRVDRNYIGKLIGMSRGAKKFKKKFKNKFKKKKKKNKTKKKNKYKYKSKSKSKSKSKKRKTKRRSQKRRSMNLRLMRLLAPPKSKKKRTKRRSRRD
jgi:hypothetical protein